MLKFVKIIILTAIIGGRTFIAGPAHAEGAAGVPAPGHVHAASINPDSATAPIDIDLYYMGTPEDTAAEQPPTPQDPNNVSGDALLFGDESDGIDEDQPPDEVIEEPVEEVPPTGETELPAGCVAVNVSFDKDYQKRVDKFAARKLLTLDDYFKTPYVAAGVKTPQLEDILFEATRVINPDALKEIAIAFKNQTAAFTQTGAWTSADVRRAIDTSASFDVCLPLPDYTQAINPEYKFLMDKSDLILYMYQIYEGKDTLLATFPTTRGGGKGFITPTGEFFVKRIVYAPTYGHPDWSKRAGQIDQPGFGNPYGVVMAELWKTKNPMCTSKTKKCDGYGWHYNGATGIRFHTSDKDSNVRRKNGSVPNSHGCNRLMTRDGKRIFTVLYYNVPHAECKKVGRGTVCPFLDTVFRYQIRQ